MTPVFPREMAALSPVRQRLHALMAETLADEARMHDWVYEAVRPMAVPPSWRPGQRVVGDCSKGVQMLCRWAGAPDPMNNGWATWGNSSTLATELRHLTTPVLLEVGDLVTIGVNGGEHATMVMSPGTDPLLWSFGHPGTPNTYWLNQDGRWPKQYLRLPAPDAPPTPQELLRARTGYWSWLKWKLGREEWRRYGPANRTVRPNVPTVISPAWWRDYARFVRNELKANALPKRANP